MIRPKDFTNMNHEDALLIQYLTELKEDIRILQQSSEENHKSLDGRIKDIENKIDLIKSVFMHWKVWLFIFFTLAFCDLKPIVKFIKPLMALIS